MVILINNSDKQVGLYSGGLISGCMGLYSGVGLIFGGGAYIWNEVSVNTCDGLIHGVANIRRFTYGIILSNVNIAQISNVSNFFEHKLYFIFI